MLCNGSGRENVNASPEDEEIDLRGGGIKMAGHCRGRKRSLTAFYFQCDVRLQKFYGFMG